MAGRLPPGGWPLVVTPAKRPGRDPTRLRTVGRQFAVDNLRAWPRSWAPATSRPSSPTAGSAGSARPPPGTGVSHTNEVGALTLSANRPTRRPGLPRRPHRSLSPCPLSHGGRFGPRLPVATGRRGSQLWIGRWLDLASTGRRRWVVVGGPTSTTTRRRTRARRPRRTGESIRSGRPRLLALGQEVAGTTRWASLAEAVSQHG